MTIDSQPLDAQLKDAFDLLQRTIDWSVADEIAPSSPQTVDTTSVVLWLLIVQRLHKDASLKAAVKHLINTQPELLPDNKRVQQQTLSRKVATRRLSFQRCGQWCSATFSPGRRIEEIRFTTIYKSPCD